jgi:hypothetical protein
LGNIEAQTLKKRDGFGNKDFVLLLENQAGGDYLIFPFDGKGGSP